MESFPPLCHRLSALLFLISVSSMKAAQGPTVAAPSESESMTRVVVQLLAIGPGGNGNNRECSATGFVVNEEGYILTNAHVIERARTCLAASPGARIMAKLAGPDSRVATAFSCELVGLDDLHDLAVLKIERPPPARAGSGEAAFALLNPSRVAVGTVVAVTGHPGFAWQPVTQAGKIIRSGKLRLSEKSAEASEVILLDIPLQVGSSGSPVYLEAGGGVVGVVESQSPSRPSETVAVPIRYAIELLDRHGVRWFENPRPPAGPSP